MKKLIQKIRDCIEAGVILEHMYLIDELERKIKIVELGKAMDKSIIASYEEAMYNNTSPKDGMETCRYCDGMG